MKTFYLSMNNQELLKAIVKKHPTDYFIQKHSLKTVPKTGDFVAIVENGSFKLGIIQDNSEMFSFRYNINQYKIEIYELADEAVMIYTRRVEISNTTSVVKLSLKEDDLNKTQMKQKKNPQKDVKKLSNKLKKQKKKIIKKEEVEQVEQVETIKEIDVSTSDLLQLLSLVEELDELEEQKQKKEISLNDFIKKKDVITNEKVVDSDFEWGEIS